MISGYFILEWLVYILVILWVLECIVSSLNDIIPLKNCEFFSLRWYLWNLSAYPDICFQNLFYESPFGKEI